MEIYSTLHRVIIKVKGGETLEEIVEVSAQKAVAPAWRNEEAAIKAWTEVRRRYNLYGADLRIVRASRVRGAKGYYRFPYPS